MPRKSKTFDHTRPKAESSQVRTRRCLMCKVRFKSEHFGNRMCDACRAADVAMVETGDAGGRKERE